MPAGAGGFLHSLWRRLLRARTGPDAIAMLPSQTAAPPADTALGLLPKAERPTQSLTAKAQTNAARPD
jgi:hypothetical protein